MEIKSLCSKWLLPFLEELASLRRVNDKTTKPYDCISYYEVTGLYFIEVFSETLICGRESEGNNFLNPDLKKMLKVITARALKDIYGDILQRVKFKQTRKN